MWIIINILAIGFVLYILFIFWAIQAGIQNKFGESDRRLFENIEELPPIQDEQDKESKEEPYHRNY